MPGGASSNLAQPLKLPTTLLISQGYRQEEMTQAATGDWCLRISWKTDSPMEPPRKCPLRDWYAPPTARSPRSFSDWLAGSCHFQCSNCQK